MVTGPRPVVPSQGAEHLAPRLAPPRRLRRESPILAYLRAVGSETPAAPAIAAIGSPRRALPRMSPVLSTPIVSPLALLTSQAEATTCWANRGMVGVPMHEPVIFTCSDGGGTGNPYQTMTFGGRRVLT